MRCLGKYMQGTITLVNAENCKEEAKMSRDIQRKMYRKNEISAASD